jgi:hypothetical protein
MTELDDGINIGLRIAAGVARRLAAVPGMDTTLIRLADVLE